MKEKIKKAPLFLFLGVFAALLGGLLLFYSTGVPAAVTAGQMRTVLFNKGLDPLDAADNAGEEMKKAGLEDCVIAQQDGIKIEFYSFDNAAAAMKVYREGYWTIVRTRMGTPRVQIKTGKFGYRFYSLDAMGTYSVALCVQNTAIYAYCGSEEKEFLVDILAAIGYIDPKD